MVEAAIEAYVLQDGDGQERLANIVYEQEWLRRAIDADLWRFVLKVDELTTERWTALLLNVTRWAFAAGQKHPAPNGEASS